MNVCENCGKIHDGKYGSGRFCSKECARGYSGKKCVNTNKRVKCKNCGKDIFVNIHSASKSFLCSECKQNVKTANLSQARVCKICGRKYLRGAHCENDFCKKHNTKQLNTLVKYFNFNSSLIGTNDVEKEFYRVRDILYNLYWVEELCGQQIAEIFGYKNTHNLTQSIFRYMEIPTRSNPSEFSKLSYLTGRNKNTEVYNTFKSGWHKTWQGNEVFLRSSYELDYALILDENEIKYKVENLHIKYFDTQRNDYRCAIPDFLLEDSNEIVEIKSSWTFNKQNMIDKFNAYIKNGYKVKLILDHKEYDFDELKLL